MSLAPDEPGEQKPECWCPAPRASGSAGLTLDATLCADITHRIVDEDFELVRIGARITRLEVLNGAMKNMGADGLLDES